MRDADAAGAVVRITQRIMEIARENPEMVQRLEGGYNDLTMAGAHYQRIVGALSGFRSMHSGLVEIAEAKRQSECAEQERNAEREALLEERNAAREALLVQIRPMSIEQLRAAQSNERFAEAKSVIDARIRSLIKFEEARNRPTNHEHIKALPNQPRQETNNWGNCNACGRPINFCTCWR